MDILFQKLQGAGNDFVIIKYEDFPHEELFPKLAQSACHRNFGIGADGLMVVKKSEVADFFMYYFNSDGSVAKMCGNGLRCFSKYIFDNKLTAKSNLAIETLAGTLDVEIIEDNGKAYNVKVNMGKMIFDPKEIPVVCDQEECIKQSIEVDGLTYEFSTVLMGVPHTVIFLDELDLDTVKSIGPIIEGNELFPENTNVNFAKIVNRKQIEVKTWERGAGYTLACGTGVTSVCGVAKYLDLVDNEVEVITDGGKLTITIMDNQEIYMEGPAREICKGVYFFNNN